MQTVAVTFHVRNCALGGIPVHFCEASFGDAHSGQREEHLKQFIGGRQSCFGSSAFMNYLISVQEKCLVKQFACASALSLSLRCL